MKPKDFVLHVMRNRPLIRSKTGFFCLLYIAARRVGLDSSFGYSKGRYCPYSRVVSHLGIGDLQSEGDLDVTEERYEINGEYKPVFVYSLTEKGRMSAADLAERNPSDARVVDNTISKLDENLRAVVLQVASMVLLSVRDDDIADMDDNKMKKVITAEASKLGATLKQDEDKKIIWLIRFASEVPF